MQHQQILLQESEKFQKQLQLMEEQLEEQREEEMDRRAVLEQAQKGLQAAKDKVAALDDELFDTERRLQLTQAEIGALER